MNVAIVGMGLIGGSFFKAAQAAGHNVAGDVAAMKALIDEGTKAKRQELLDRRRGDENV